MTDVRCLARRRTHHRRRHAAAAAHPPRAPRGVALGATRAHSV